MKTILYIVQKEFKQIFRNRAMLPLIFIMPIIQILVLSYAATFDVKDIKTAILDRDHSTFSRDLISKFEASKSFRVVGYYTDVEVMHNDLQKGIIDVSIEIPFQFEKKLIQNKKSSLGVQIDAVDGAAAGVINGYINQIVRQFTVEQIKQNQNILTSSTNLKQLEIIPRFWFNQELNYKFFMVPGIIVMLVTMISFFLSGMNIVREKEIGTLEQINVTPIKKHQFIIGKLLPFWILGLFLLIFGMTIGRLLFHIPVVGNPLVIFSFAALYILVFLGFGLYISNITETQQQAMFISWFFTVVFILMSGLFTPIESMPEWAQKITVINPIKYFIEVIRMVMLKGSGFYDVQKQFIAIIILAIIFNAFSIISYNKTK